MAQIFVGILPKVAQVHFSIHNLKEKGFIVLSGRVSRKYLEEMIYGYPTDTEDKEEN